MCSIHKAASLLSITVIAPDSLSYPQQRSVSKKGAECTRKTWAVGDKKVRLVFAWWKRHQKMSALCWKRTLQSKPQRALFGNWESFWYEQCRHAADGGRAEPLSGGEIQTSRRAPPMTRMLRQQGDKHAQCWNRCSMACTHKGTFMRLCCDKDLGFANRLRQRGRVDLCSRGRAFSDSNCPVVEIKLERVNH